MLSPKSFEMTLGHDHLLLMHRLLADIANSNQGPCPVHHPDAHRVFWGLIEKVDNLLDKIEEQLIVESN